MMSTCNTPILFLIFNRPDLTERVFQRIREIKPRRLYIAADGPRAARQGEYLVCVETRKITEIIDWDCEVYRLYRDENLGCKIAVSGAIAWFFEHVESGIILEDDCLPSLSFFHFCSELLERYKERDDMGIIGGSCPVCLARDPDDSYYFSKYPHIWGWATWRKVWQHYDVDLNSWNGSDSSLRHQLPNRIARKYWADIFDSVKKGEIDTWDYQLAHLCLAFNRMSISPTINLVENIGFDERATHTTVRDVNKQIVVGREINLCLSHPTHFKVDETLDLNDEKVSWGIDRSHAWSRQSWANFRVVGGKVLRLLKLK